jgi:hypothetical protein
MVHSGKIPMKEVEKAGELEGEASIRSIAEKIGAIERKCDSEGFDSHVVEDIGGMLTLGVCAESGISLDAERLGISLLDADRKSIELDIANRIRSKSAYLSRAAEEVLGPLLESPDRNNALAYWTTVNRRLGSNKVGDIERKWLNDEDKRQDSVLMRGVGSGFTGALSEGHRKSSLVVFSKIRRAGNRIPVFGRLFKFS